MSSLRACRTASPLIAMDCNWLPRTRVPLRRHVARRFGWRSSTTSRGRRWEITGDFTAGEERSREISRPPMGARTAAETHQWPSLDGRRLPMPPPNAASRLPPPDCRLPIALPIALPMSNSAFSSPVISHQLPRSPTISHALPMQVKFRILVSLVQVISQMSVVFEVRSPMSSHDPPCAPNETQQQ